MDPASAGMTFSAPDLWPLTPTRSMPLLSKTPREVLRAMSESLGNSRVSDQHHAPQLGVLKFCHGAPRVSRAKFTEEVTSCEKRSYEKRKSRSNGMSVELFMVGMASLANNQGAILLMKS
jgi:hypothetical protein